MWHEDGGNNVQLITDAGTNPEEAGDLLTAKTHTDDDMIRIDLTDDESDDSTPEDIPLELISEEDDGPEVRRRYERVDEERCVRDAKILESKRKLPEALKRSRNAN